MRKLVFLLLFAVALPGQARSFEQPELDALLAPVALYPDELVSHILVAAAYPDQVSDAARGTPAQPHWHPSVSALIPYPELLQRMAESPQWMQDLSQAYIHQQASVMLTVQSLRTRAAAHGHVPPEPQREVAYVRYYDPLIVYGGWWWPAYRPVFWRPWHVHRVFVPHHHHHRAAPRHAPPRHFHAPVSKPLHAKPLHTLPAKIPEAQRRPIVNSTPQLHQKPRSFAHTAPRAAASKPPRAAASAPRRSFARSQEGSSASIQPRGFSRSSQHAKPR